MKGAYKLNILSCSRTGGGEDIGVLVADAETASIM
jgi:hypothetical protein